MRTVQLWQLRSKICDDQGSLAPLGIGLSSLALLLVVATLLANSLYLTDKRLTSVAEATALASYDQRSTTEGLQLAAEQFLNQHPLFGLQQVEIIDIGSPDGRTVKVRLCSKWNAPIIGYAFSDTGRVCSEGLARRGR